MRPCLYLVSASILAGAAVLGGGVGSKSAAETRRHAPALQNPDYVGHVIGMPDVKVVLRLERKRRGGDRVLFQAQDEMNVCEDGTERVTGLIGSHGLSRSGHFDALYTQGPADDGGDVGLSLAHGKLKGKTAHGFALRVFFPSDSGTQDYNANECWGAGKIRWRARRVDRRSTSSHGHQAGPSDTARRARAMSSVGSAAETNRATARRATSGLKLHAVAGEPDRVEVSGRIQLYCDGSNRIKKLPKMILPTRHGRIERLVYNEQPDSRRRAFTWIRGKIGRGGRASGVLAHYRDPWDPEGSLNRPECLSGAPLMRWRTSVR